VTKGTPWPRPLPTASARGGVGAGWPVRVQASLPGHDLPLGRVPAPACGRSDPRAILGHFARGAGRALLPVGVKPGASRTPRTNDKSPPAALAARGLPIHVPGHARQAHFRCQRSEELTDARHLGRLCLGEASGLAGVLIVLALVAGVWYWSGWRRSDSALPAPSRQGPSRPRRGSSQGCLRRGVRHEEAQPAQPLHGDRALRDAGGGWGGSPALVLHARAREALIGKRSPSITFSILRVVAGRHKR
jgi:hypothetical protein